MWDACGPLFPMRFPAFSICALVSISAFAGGIPSLATGQEASGTEDGVRLSPHFFVNKVYTYVNETKVTMTLPSPDGGSADREVTMSQQARLETSVRGANLGGTQIDASTERLQFSVVTPDREMKYDSDDDSTKESALGRHFEGARKRTVTLQLDDTPRVVSAEEKGGGGPATPMPGMPEFGPDELKQLVSNLLQGFPPDPVTPGSEWTQKGTRSLGQFGEMDFEIAYRYRGDETIEGADCAVIEFTGKMKGDVAVAGQGGSGTLGFEGTGLSGRLVFDKLRRTVRESTQTVEMTIEVPSPDPARPGNLSLPMRQQVSIKLISLQDGEAGN